MSRLTALDPDDSTNKSKELFDVIKKKMGMVPNMMRTMGNSPSVLNGYLGFSGALEGASLGSKLSELIALTVANENGCDYCNAAHTFVGGKKGIDSNAIDMARDGFSTDLKTKAALEFAKEVLATKGRVSDISIESIKNAGYNDGAIAEIIASVALSVFTNYFNNVADTEIDFPKLSLINKN
ncbi:MAG: carboxymuconolactone decarboxylase family protein [Flavobacterium sp.]|nr:carboxymuconolactone decarboxylase family protein [Flavobacterium sp.]